jgi:hypothetical protein
MSKEGMSVQAPKWFRKPRTEVAQGESGQVESVSIRLRDGKASHTTRPSEGSLVLFFWGADGYPIGIQLLQPVEGVALFQLVTHLEPDGVDMEMRGHFFTTKQLDDVLHEMIRAARKLPAAPGAC